MAEVYPVDNELLNMIGDSETGVEFIATGTAPYYLHFRKLLYRLLLATKRANDLRVYDEGGLDIGVKAGKFFKGINLVSYAGSSGNTLADDKESIYLYLDSSGALITDEYAGFPDMATERHVRLAVVTTDGGDVSSIVDSRDHHSIAVPVSGDVVIESHTSDDGLGAGESGSVHTNLGAGGTVKLTLPASASAGARFTFAVQAAQQLRIDPGISVIRDDSGQMADKYKWSDSIGACIVLVADENGDWVAVAKNGTWTEEI